MKKPSSLQILKSLSMAAILLTVNNLYAQNTGVINTNLNVGATVLAQLKLTNNSDVQFGNLSATTPGHVFLSPTGSGHTNTGVSTSVGKFTVEGSTSGSVKVTWPANIVLNSSIGSNTLIYNLQVNGNGSDLASGSTILGTGGLGVAATADVTLVAGKYYLYVGGKVGGTAGSAANLNAQATGVYTGIANFRVEYN
ncbi:MAG: DUF4402 domain-containing protein [Bacteroidia bacterium]|jgi:hypothetical protein